MKFKEGITERMVTQGVAAELGLRRTEKRSRTGVERLATHGRELFAAADPAAILCFSPPVSYDRDGDAVVATLPLPGADIEHLDVAKVENELTITVGLRRRLVVLPRSNTFAAKAGWR